MTTSQMDLVSKTGVKMAPSKIDLTCAEVLPILNDEESDIRAFVERAQATAKRATLVEKTRRDQKDGFYSEGAVDADAALDDAFAAIDQNLQAYERMGGRGSGQVEELAQAARALRAVVFPRGFKAETQATFTDEVASVRSLRERLGADDAASGAIARVPGFQFQLGVLEERAEALAALLARPTDAPVTYADAQAAAARANMRFSEMISAIIVRYWGDADEGEEAAERAARREELLAPIAGQVAIMRATYRRNRRGKRPSGEGVEEVVAESYEIDVA